MVQDAQANAEQDRRRREEIDARNELDTLAYQVEHLLEERKDLPVHEKARAEQLVSDARAAIEAQSGLDAVRPLISDLQQALQSIAAAPSAAGAPTSGPGDGGPAGGAAGGSDEEEVVDAEFTRG
jgi:molecular chaperone DnaK